MAANASVVIESLPLSPCGLVTGSLLAVWF